MSAETPNQKFHRLLKIRLPNALKAIELVGNLGSKTYEFSKAEAEDVIGALRKAVDELAYKLGGVPSFVLKPESKTAQALVQLGWKTSLGVWGQVGDAYEQIKDAQAKAASDPEASAAHLDAALKLLRNAMAEVEPDKIDVLS